MSSTLPDPQASATQEHNSGGAAESAVPGVKVELDLDDAPFLEEEEEKKPEPQPQPQPQRQEAEAAAALPEASGFRAKLRAFFSSKKRVALTAAALLLLLIAPVGINFLLSAKQEAPPAPAVQRIVVDGAALKGQVPPGPAYLFNMEPFIVPVQGSEGELRFLRCRFAVPAGEAVLHAELRAKNIAVRDAVYYYLSHKPLAFLLDKEQTYLLKQDIISVINEQVTSAKIQDLYIEEYLVTGS
ncbi:flagellar basal body-associated FliL family protein [Desulfovibrio sp. OttesenSCG-928-A18]|nr:flagellar basal body-associated FliL family protein [Desulfovibrio sp. OttesenSCG-928-A18]